METKLEAMAARDDASSEDELLPLLTWPTYNVCCMHTCNGSFRWSMMHFVAEKK